MVEWTRRQNINKDPIVFRGIDMQSADKAQGLLHTTLNKDATAQQLQEEIIPKLGQIRTYNFVGSARIGPLQASEIRQDLNRFETITSDTQNRAIQKQCITLNRQHIGMGLLNWRDRCMAENLLWIRQQQSESRIVLWTHNGHVTRSANRMLSWTKSPEKIMSISDSPSTKDVTRELPLMNNRDGCMMSKRPIPAP